MIRDKRRLLNDTANVPVLGALKFASIMSGLRARATDAKLERAKQQFPEDSPRVERLRRRKERMQKSADVLERRHAAAVEAVAYEVRQRSAGGGDAEIGPSGLEKPTPEPGGHGHGEPGGGSSGAPGGPSGPTPGGDASTAGASGNVPDAHGAAPTGAGATPAAASDSSGEPAGDASSAETGVSRPETTESGGSEGEEGGTSTSRRARRGSKRKDHS